MYLSEDLNVRAPFMTITSAAEELSKDPRYIRGMAVGMGISLHPIANGLCMSREDYERVKARVREHDERSATLRPVEV